jgi:hypothetical protein
MTNHVARLYIAAASLLGFFLAWAGIAAHPWSSSSAAARDPAAAEVARYEQRLRADAELVRQLTTGRASQAVVPPVRIVTVPPVTTTRTS